MKSKHAASPQEQRFSSDNGPDVWKFGSLLKYNKQKAEARHRYMYDDGLFSPVLAPESEFRDVNPVLLHHLEALECRISVPEHQSALQQHRSINIRNPTKIDLPLAGSRCKKPKERSRWSTAVYRKHLTTKSPSILEPCSWYCLNDDDATARPGGDIQRFLRADIPLTESNGRREREKKKENWQRGRGDGEKQRGHDVCLLKGYDPEIPWKRLWFKDNPISGKKFK